MLSTGRDVEVRTADGVRIVLHRIGPAGGASGTPVLLASGTFTGRDFWVGARRQGFALALAESGFDTWVLEPRGHGASDRPASWTMEDWIRLDAPAAVAAVLRESRAPGVYWVGHSAGGVVGAAFSGSAAPEARRLRGLVLLGTPGPRLHGLRRAAARVGHAAARAFPGASVPGGLLGLGREPEPGALVRDWLAWNLSGAWRASDGSDYLAALGGVRAPILAIAGSADRLLAPPAAVRDLLHRFGAADRELVVAGRAMGFAHDFDHPGLMIGSPARREIWPRILQWLHRHADGIGDP